MLELDRVSLGVMLTEGDVPTPFTEALINSVIERIVNDVYMGVGTPLDSFGDDGDTFINLATNGFRVKASGAWGAETLMGITDTSTVLMIKG